MIPQQIGRYEILAKIGEGGISTVYKAFDPILKRHLAIKVLKVVDTVLVRRFFREARAQAGVNHPNICPIYDFGEVNGIPFIAMQWIQGQPLQEAAKHLTLEKILIIIQKIALALHQAHQKGLIHRDLKPSNIMVEITKEGELVPKIIDFGLVKEKNQADSSLPGMIVGTLGYMAPEQIEGKADAIDRRTDVYGLGAVLYTLLSGVPPFSGDTFEALKAAMEEVAVALRKIKKNIPADVETIVMKCLEKEPRQRYASAKALAEDIQRFLQDEPIRAKRAHLGYRLWKKIKRHKQMAALTILAIVTIAFLFGQLLISRHEQNIRQNYALEFEQQIQYLEDMLWYTYSLPVHPIGPELEIMQQRLEQIKKKFSKMGKLAYGPGHYALGRGHLLLRQYQQARECFELAWDKYRYRVPNVSFFLCLTLSKLYAKEKEQVEKITEPTDRKKAEELLKKRYLPRIQEHLQKAKDAEIEIQGYLEAICAFQEGKYDLSLEKITLLKGNFPYLYDAFKLEGEIYRRLGIDRGEQGDKDNALAFFRQAEKLLTDLCDHSESDPDAYKELSKVEIALMDLLIHQSGESADEPFTKALQALDNAHIIDVDDPELLVLFSYAYWKRATSLMYMGKDPQPLLRQSVDWAEKAIAADSNHYDPYYHRATSFLELAAYYTSLGKDPRPFLQSAIAGFKKALQLNPNHLMSYNNLGLSFWNLAQFSLRNNDDPVPFFIQGAEILEKRVLVDSQFSSLYHTLGNIYLERTYYERTQGWDATASLQKTHEALSHSLRLNPHNALSYNNLAEYYKIVASMERERGALPDSSWDRARECIQKAIAIKPNFVWTYLTAVDIELEQAKWALQVRKDPRPFLERAWNYMVAAESLGSFSQPFYELKGIYFLLKAQIERKNPRAVMGTARAGIQAIESYLAKAPASAELLAQRGCFYMLRAEAEKNKVLYQKGIADLRKAFSQAPRLEKEYAVFLQRAEKALR